MQLDNIQKTIEEIESKLKVSQPIEQSKPIYQPLIEWYKSVDMDKVWGYISTGFTALIILFTLYQLFSMLTMS
jgi:hypothetical protein